MSAGLRDPALCNPMAELNSTKLVTKVNRASTTGRGFTVSVHNLECALKSKILHFYVGLPAPPPTSSADGGVRNIKGSDFSDRTRDLQPNNRRTDQSPAGTKDVVPSDHK